MTREFKLGERLRLKERGTVTVTGFIRTEVEATKQRSKVGAVIVTFDNRIMGVRPTQHFLPVNLESRLEEKP